MHNKDLYKPWEVQRTNNCSPGKVLKKHRVVFADKVNQTNSQQNSKSNKLSPTYLNNLRNTPNLSRKSLHPKNPDTINYDVDDFLIDQQIKKAEFNPSTTNTSNLTTLTTKSSKTRGTHSFKIHEKSSAEIISTPIPLVKNVVEKFNQLTKKVEIEQELFLRRLHKIEDVSSNKSVETLYSTENDKSSRSSTKKQLNKSHDDLKSIQVKTSSLKYDVHSPILRSERMKFTNNECTKTSKIIHDELLELFQNSDTETLSKGDSKKTIEYTPRNTLDNLLLSKSEFKRFNTAQTQTSPNHSGTNILINVYNTASPRRCVNLPTMLKIQENDNNELFIQNVKQLSNGETNDGMQESVKYCIDKFEETSKINGNTTKKFFKKIKSNYLLKNPQDPLLSPKASSVPF